MPPTEIEKLLRWARRAGHGGFACHFFPNENNLYVVGMKPFRHSVMTAYGMGRTLLDALRKAKKAWEERR